MSRFQIYRRLMVRGHKWFWSLRSTKNGQILASGGEGYSRRIDATEAVGRIQMYAPMAEMEIGRLVRLFG